MAPSVPPTDADSPSAGEILRRLESGELVSEALTRDSLARAQARRDLNAFVTLDEAGALAAARESDRRRRAGAARALEGLPIVVKDNIDVAGLPCTAGTPALRRNVPRQDAPVVARLREAGAVILGKTSLHELALGISGYNPTNRSETTIGIRNAYDPGRIAGGSSSGTGAAIGARIVSAGLGTDTGGSVRIPAALNGCCGLRPTHGRYPRSGIVPLSRSRDTAGPMALGVADLALLDRLLGDGEGKKSAGEGLIHPAPAAGLRLGVVAQCCAGLDHDTASVFAEARARMTAAGMSLLPVSMPGLFALSDAIDFPLVYGEAFDDLTEYLAAADCGVGLRQLTRQVASPDVREAVASLIAPHWTMRSGRRRAPLDALAIRERALNVSQVALRDLYARAFAEQRLDALVFPTVPAVAIEATAQASEMAHFLTFIRNTRPGTCAGLPGLQLPIALGPSSGLPVGLALDGLAGDDRRLLAIGLTLETLFGRLPPPRPVA